MAAEPSGTPAGLMYKNYGPSSCNFMSLWTIINQVDLKLNQPTWGSFEIPRLVYLCSHLGTDYKTKQTE